jgi:hypothetical protein
VSNPAQNQGPYSVIVKLPEVRAISEEPGEGEINGTVSSVSSSAASIRAGISWKVAGNRQTTGAGSSISKNMSFLRPDHAESQASLSGVRKFAQRRFPGTERSKPNIDRGINTGPVAYPIYDLKVMSQGLSFKDSP